MATQRFISTSFWDDEWIQTLDPSEKLLYLYLMTNPLTNIAGVYEITSRRICFDTGFNSDTVGHILDKFSKAKKALLHNGYIVIPAWPQHQKADSRPKIKEGIDAILKRLDKEMIEYIISVGYRYDIGSYRYVRNYSDSDSDSDSDLDTDTDRKKASDKKSKSEYSQDFLTFYDSYPRKEGKTQANKTFSAVTKKGVSLEKIMAALAVYKAQIERKHTEPQYIKLPATFLNCLDDFAPQEPTPAPRRTRLVFKAGQVCTFCQTPLPQGRELCPHCNADLSVGMERDKYEEVEV